MKKKEESARSLCPDEGRVYVLDLTRAKNDARNDSALFDILEEYFTRLERDYDLYNDSTKEEEYAENLQRIHELEKKIIERGYEYKGN